MATTQPNEQIRIERGGATSDGLMPVTVKRSDGTWYTFMGSPTTCYMPLVAPDAKERERLRKLEDALRLALMNPQRQQPQAFSKPVKQWKTRRHKSR